MKTSAAQIIQGEKSVLFFPQSVLDWFYLWLTQNLNKTETSLYLVCEMSPLILCLYVMSSAKHEGV